MSHLTLLLVRVTLPEVASANGTHRVGISKFATRLSRIICKSDIADPMSGFFMMRRGAFDRAVHNLSGQGFKILLDLLASSPEPMRVKELPYEFRQRRFGTSKLDTLVAWEFGVLSRQAHRSPRSRALCPLRIHRRDRFRRPPTTEVCPSDTFHFYCRPGDCHRCCHDLELFSQ